MFAVEIYAAVRRFVFIEGKSRREAARVFGLSRDTIAKMCRYSAPPGYVRSKAPERPKLGLLVPVIDAILESDKTAPPKQRHTAKRIFERLRLEHGFAGGYTVVKGYVRIAPSRWREGFVPLAHPPGHAQVDFGECIGVIGGVRMKLHVFCFDPATFEAEPFRSLIRRGMAGDVRGGDLRSGSTVCLRRREEPARGGAGFGLSRDTIAKMCRYSAPPGYVRSKAPKRPKLGPLVPVIDAILESDKTAPPKQRHTAKRIFERLRLEHGFAGGYTVVKDYVRIARSRSREVFVPLAHPPGHAQVDFGECIGVIGGVRMKLHVFCFDLSHSTPASSRPIRRRRRKLFLTGTSRHLPFSAAYRCRFCSIISKSRWRAFWATASASTPAPSRSLSAIISFKSGLAARGRETTRYHEDPRQSCLAPAVQNARHERG